MKKIVIIEGHRPSFMTEDNFFVEKEVLGQGCEISHFSILNLDDAKKVLPTADAVIARPGMPFTKEYIDLLDNCKVIVSNGVGYDHIDLTASEKKGVSVCNVPDYGTEEVADTAIAMIMAHTRKIFLPACNAQYSKKMEWDWRGQISQKRTSSLKAGIIGLGRIGTAVALRLKALQFQVSFYDTFLPRGAEKGVGIKRYFSINEMIKDMDIVTLHVPATLETIGMIDEGFIEQLKDDCVLINVSRGTLFKSMRLLHLALKQRLGLRVGTDVWQVEPPGDDTLITDWINNEPWLVDRLILTPHSGFYSDKAVYELRRFCVDLISHVLNGGEPYNIV